MQGRTFALTVLFVGAVVSFALAMWSAIQGRLPLIETAHAVLFAVAGLILAAKPAGSLAAGACRECGSAFDEASKFCLRCGSYPKVRQVVGNPA